MHPLPCCPRWVLWVALATAWGLAGCSEKPVDLIWAEDQGGGSLGGAKGKGPAASGGADLGGETGGSTGEGGAGVIGGCDSVEDLYLVRQSQSELCLQKGATTTVGGAPAFQVQLAPCTSGIEQLWALLPQADADVYEFRHVETGYNLDIRFASSADGTVAILFEPHQLYELYNQRFFVRSGPAAGTEDELVGGPRWLAPRHVDSKCLTHLSGAAEGTEMQIWPCAAEATNQRWEIEPAGCPSP